jgi:hypothetical protein
MHRPTVAVRYAILAVGVVYTVLLLVSGVHLGTWYRYVIAALPAAGSIVLAVWDGWAWRLPGLAQLTHRPRIDGLWKVELIPTAESHIPPGGNRGPIPGFLVVNQSYWSIHVRQFTAESASRSRAFFWEHPDGAQAQTLVFVYENVPQQQFEHRSNRHFGACSFDIGSLTPKTITGVYFTDRYTKGDMKLTLVDRSKIYGSFDEAHSRADAARPKP